MWRWQGIVEACTERLCGLHLVIRDLPSVVQRSGHATEDQQTSYQPHGDACAARLGLKRYHGAAAVAGCSRASPLAAAMAGEPANVMAQGKVSAPAHDLERSALGGVGNHFHLDRHQATEEAAYSCQ